MTKGEDTRSQIVGTALSMATQVGLLGLSIGSLAESLRMSKSGLFAHFRSKENLQIAVLEEAARRFQAQVVLPALRQPRGEPRVRALLENWLGWARADFMPGGCIFLSAAAELDDHPGPPRDFLVELESDLQSTLARAARVAIEHGDFRQDLDTAQFAFEWLSLMLGMNFHERLLGRPDAEARLHTAFDRLLADARGAPGRRGRR